MVDKTKEGDLRGIFVAMRKHKDSMQELVELLEDEQNFTCYHSDKKQYQTFCEAYTIALLEQYVRDPDVREPMLASYQLLDDYDRLKFIRDRHMRYSERAINTNKLISRTWPDPNDALQKIEDPAIDKLVDQLIEDATSNEENQGLLGLASTVVEQLKKRFPNGLPKKLPLPKPRYKEQDTAEAPTGPGKSIGSEEPDRKSPPDESEVPQKPSKIHISRDINNSLIIQLGDLDIQLQWLVLPACAVLLAIGFLIYVCFLRSANEPSVQNNVLIPGEIRQIVIVMPSGESIDKLLEYVSSDPGLIEVSDDGFLLAHRGQPGETRRTAEITVKDETGVIATEPFTVDFTSGSFDPPVEDINDFVPSFLVTQKIRLAGTTEWTTSVDAKIGDIVEIQIKYENISEITQENVMIRDVLPPNLDYIPGTTKLYNVEYDGGILSEGINTTGVNIGNYTSGSNAYVRFSAKVVDVNLAPGSNTLVNWSKAGVGPVTLNDYATAVVQKQ